MGLRDNIKEYIECNSGYVTFLDVFSVFRDEYGVTDLEIIECMVSLVDDNIIKDHRHPESGYVYWTYIGQ